MRFSDISLQQFGRLTASFPVGKRNGNVWWACLCVCGNTLMVAATTIRQGHTKSCGCLQRETTAVRNAAHCGEANSRFKHGQCVQYRHRPTYSSWFSMTQRCMNANLPKKIWSH